MAKMEAYKSPAAMKKHERKESPAKKTAEKKAGVKHSTTAKKAASKKIALVMGEFKRGTLHGGVDPKGPKKAAVVKSRKQALAIALSKARSVK